ncbi:preprotein translocase subunit YajC [Marinicella rhabdoformis]|uniref:preprotein translocase subunit YajC n=1 Tax=Marinicella rhabdoformis TaxID=2580566 RepID=UPI0012AED9A6|nr:preprotein translocase subunit YajC [Marinicella rhabdoformis]
MNFLISDAMAQSGAQQQSDPMITLFFMVGIFAVMYFLMIRPQQKRMKAHQEMVNALGVGDEVITNGGTLGKITHVDETFAKVEIAENTEVHVQRSAIAKVLPKGTIKSLK